MLGVDTKRKLTWGAGGLVALALISSGCTIHDHDDDGCYDCYPHDDDGYHPPSGTETLRTIDADYTLSTPLGLGAGLFVEYSRGGTWKVWTSCDTDVYGHYCYWDIYVTSFGTVDTIDLYDVEEWDYVEPLDGSSFFFYAETGSFSDEVVFTTAPGELVEISVDLDGRAAPEYIVWYGNGLLHDWVEAPGVSTQPVIFQPDAP